MSTPRQFKINRSSFSRHYTVLAPDGQPLYYVDQSAFTRDKANLTLHAGADGSGAVVAVVHLPHLSRDVKIGLGDPSSPGDITWEEMNRASRDASAHQWSVTLPHAGGKKTFVWKRTHKVSADGMSSSAWTTRDLKLVEVGADETVVGMFTSKRGWSSCGVLQINADYGTEFDLMATATMLAIYERARKRRAAAAAGGASS
ncbi:hypothetical protein PWT90_08550 [Aphanocladium album]|nr:hypothetical protein PWT90_08550 [Aphanocladium album]